MACAPGYTELQNGCCQKVDKAGSILTSCPGIQTYKQAVAAVSSPAKAATAAPTILPTKPTTPTAQAAQPLKGETRMATSAPIISAKSLASVTPAGGIPSASQGSILGAVLGGLGGLITGGPGGAVVGAIGGYESGGGAPAGGGSLAAGCPSGYHQDGNQCVPNATTTIAGILPGGSSGGYSMAGNYGGAVMGAFGVPALQPAADTRTSLRCPAGSVLGRDDLCYNKGTIPRKFRKWRKSKPYVTRAQYNLIAKADRQRDKILRLAKKSGLHASKNAPKRCSKKKK